MIAELVDDVMRDRVGQQLRRVFHHEAQPRDRRDAVVGPQPDRIGDTSVWILPNPSGLNAHYTLDRLAAEFAALREVAIG